ncbi:MAG: hypothetical protein ACXWQQ_09825 [Pseudobdellovibrio sp.]
MKHILLATLGVFLFLSNAAKAADEAPYESFFTKKQVVDSDGTEIYKTNYEMKQYKRIGAGIAVGGVSGVMGVNAELNLAPAETLVIGMGTGPSYGTFNLQGKYNFEANYLTPFVKVGYSKWFNSGTIPSEAATSDTLRQVYSDRDLRAGKFDANFAVASIGAEYNQLEGELSGINFYGEFTILAETRTAAVIPSGALGIIYFY